MSAKKDESSAKKDLTCSTCKKILLNPVTLPCGCGLCEEHVPVADKTAKEVPKIKCVKCDKEFPAQDFKPHRDFRKQLDNESYLSNDEFDIKHFLIDSIDRLPALAAELKKNASETEAVSQKHFEEIKRKIEERKDALKAKIDEIAAKMLAQTKTSEELFKKRLGEKSQLSAKDETSEITAKFVTEKFREPNLALDSVKTLKDKQEKKINDLSFKIKEAKAFRCELDIYDFKTAFELLTSHFGVLNRRDQHIYSCSYDKSIKIWDLETSECIKTLTGHKKSIRCFELLSDVSTVKK